MIRLMEILLHGGTQLAGWRAQQIHDALLTAFGLLRQTLRPEPTALRFAQNESPRPART